MQEAKFLRLVIVFLLLLNLGTLGFLWLGGRPGPPAGDRDHENAAQYLRRKLNFTDIQEAKYRTLREAHHAAVENIRDDMRAQERSMYVLLSLPAMADSGKSLACMDSIAAFQRRVEQITFDHFREVRALCTPEQQREFDIVIGEALNRLR